MMKSGLATHDSITISPTVSEVVRPNERRSALILSHDTAAVFRLSLYGPPPITSGWMNIPVNTGRLVLNLEDHGQIVQASIWGQTAALTRPFRSVSHLMPKGPFDDLPWIERMSRTIANQIVGTPATTPGTPMVPQNLKRVALIFGPPTSGSIVISLSTGVSSTAGIAMGTTSPCLVLNLKDHGELVRSGYFISHSVGNVVYAVWEVLEP